MASPGFAGKEYENLVRDGITAARGGRRAIARRLLQRAAGQRPTDPRVWLWLSATTDDPEEQRDFLGKALAADPSNAAAQRGLALLVEKLEEPVSDLPQRSLQVDPDGSGGAALDPETQVDASTQSFSCPNCGGRMYHAVDDRLLTCEYCGFTRETSGERVADSAETLFGPVLRTEQAHRWAAGLHAVACEKCGAQTLESGGTQARQCAYCGSNQLVDSPQLDALIEPQAVGLFAIEEAEALDGARQWLNTGLFSPDDLQQESKNLLLRPAYYPFWTFDGGVEVRWRAELRENYGRSTYAQPEWRLSEGSVVEFFDDELVPGVRALKPVELSGITPFDLKAVVSFDPDHLAGWRTLAYDRSLSDASVLARESILKRLRPRVRAQIEPGKEKRSVQVSSGKWSGVTYKHVLLPLWIGTYHYKGEEYHVLVNGQTGKVGGEKPQDGFKVAGIWLIVLIFAAAALAAIVWAVLNLRF